VLEDGCEATFVPNTGWGHIFTTSFFSNHLISGGGGGAICTNDDELDLFCWKLINHGRASRFSNEDIHLISEKFKFDSWGHSSKWNDVSAAIVKAQIERRHVLYGMRKARGAFLNDKLAGLEHPIRFLPSCEAHCFMMYPIVLNNYMHAESVIQKLNDKNIEIRRCMPITNQPIVQATFKGFDLEKLMPNAHYWNQFAFYVGCHPELSMEQVEYLADSIIEVLS
jgi:dTDP-4-amino-4,6-dideoxygalactose transaminase